MSRVTLKAVTHHLARNIYSRIIVCILCSLCYRDSDGFCMRSLYDIVLMIVGC